MRGEMSAGACSSRAFSVVVMPFDVVEVVVVENGNARDGYAAIARATAGGPTHLHVAASRRTPSLTIVRGWVSCSRAT